MAVGSFLFLKEQIKGIIIIITAGRRSLVFDLSMTHDLFGSSRHVQQNGLLSHHQDPDSPLRLAV